MSDASIGSPLALHWEALDATLLGPALLAGLLVLASHVPLGRRVLARGIVFIDLAIAQIAALGVIGAGVLGAQPQGWTAQLAAAGAALLGALALTWTERRWPEVQEALIGVSFVLASCVGLILLARHPQGGEHLKDLLVGQVLWVTPAQLAGMAALTAVLGVLAAALRALARQRPGVAQPGFYVLFALAVTGSVQLVGVYLVFASLILPALATRGLDGPRQLAWAAALGVGGYALGLAASALLDWPSGAVIVLAMALLAPLVAWLVRPARAVPSSPA